MDNPEDLIESIFKEWSQEEDICQIYMHPEFTRMEDLKIEESSVWRMVSRHEPTGILVAVEYVIDGPCEDRPRNEWYLVERRQLAAFEYVRTN